MPEQYPYRRKIEADPLPYLVDTWDERGNRIKEIGRIANLELARALFWCAVAKSRGKDRLILRLGAQILEKSPSDF